jgi:hypothetical protein
MVNERKERAHDWSNLEREGKVGSLVLRSDLETVLEDALDNSVNAE